MNLFLLISNLICLRPFKILFFSDTLIIFCFASISACAIEPSISSSNINLSKSIEEFISVKISLFL